MPESPDFHLVSGRGFSALRSGGGPSTQKRPMSRPAEAGDGDRGLVPVPSQAARSAFGCQRCFSNAASVGVSNIALT